MLKTRYYGTSSLCSFLTQEVILWILRRHYLPIHPPSITRSSPLTYPLALLARYTAAPLRSSGLPHRPAGIRDKMLLCLSSSAISGVFISVSMYPGAIAFTLIPRPAHSLLSALVSWATPPFEAAYAGTLKPPWKERMEPIFMIAPLLPDSGIGLERR